MVNSDHEDKETFAMRIATYVEYIRGNKVQSFNSLWIICFVIFMHMTTMWPNGIPGVTQSYIELFSVYIKNAIPFVTEKIFSVPQSKNFIKELDGTF